LPESCRQRWTDLLAARRTARKEDDKKEAENLMQFGLGFVKALYLTEQISIASRDDLRAALISA
jgi:aryl carrier-like protein